MITNYIKIAWRNLMKNKVFSFINIFGLSAGLACCMLITVYLLNELSYDKYHPRAGDLYQVITTFITQHKESTWATTPAPMAAALKKEFPEVEGFTRIQSLLFEDKTLLQYKDPGASGSPTPLSFYETKGMIADSSFFRLFKYDFIEGDPQSALLDPSTVVLSEEIAHKLFGHHSALNKVIHVSSNTNGDHDFKVTGVFRPLGSPTSIDGRFFMSIGGGDMEAFAQRQANDFATNNMFYSFLLLKPGADPKKLDAKFPAFLDKYAGKTLKEVGFDKRQFLVAVPDVHLRNDINTNVSPAGSKTYLYILGSIAAFTLLIACINFMNLATARSAKRSAEVGVRKVLGAEKRSLIGQFLGESVLMSLIAFILAWLISLALLPLFGKMTGRSLSLAFPENLPLFLAFLALGIFTGLLAGIYPAFYLSSFRPVQVLKGKFTNSLAAVSLRKGLVVFQFMISVALIISTVVIQQQMQYLRSADLGFEKAGQLIVPLRSAKAKASYLALKNEFGRNPQVASVGASYFYPGILNIGDQLFYLPGQGSQEGKLTKLNFIDMDYLQTIGIQATAGRLFGHDFPADTASRVVMNENAIRTLGFKNAQEAIGKKIYSTFRGQESGYEIVGVVKDFHFEDLHQPIMPYAFLLNNRPNYSYMILHTRTGTTAQLLRSLETSWHQLDPDEPFEYSFLDADFQKNYMADERLSTMINYFTVMAILISCLGLFGLASFSAEQRIKEIGIRKVLGASVSGIVLLLSKDFLKLVGISVLIASPLSWWVMHKWLQDFAYRTQIDWMVFALSFVITLFIALFTISFQAIRAAIANPVKNLKTE